MDYQDVEKIKQAAYIISQSVCAIIRAMGMVADNKHRESCGYSIAYDGAAFENLLIEFGIHHNAVMKAFE